MTSTGGTILVRSYSPEPSVSDLGTAMLLEQSRTKTAAWRGPTEDMVRGSGGRREAGEGEGIGVLTDSADSAESVRW